MIFLEDADNCWNWSRHGLIQEINVLEQVLLEARRRVTALESLLREIRSDQKYDSLTQAVIDRMFENAYE